MLMLDENESSRKKLEEYTNVSSSDMVHFPSCQGFFRGGLGRKGMTKKGETFLRDGHSEREVLLFSVSHQSLNRWLVGFFNMSALIIRLERTK